MSNRSEIDDTAYAEGVALFSAGATLRQVIDRALACDGAPQDGKDKALSIALGFVDALLTAFRGVLAR